VTPDQEIQIAFRVVAVAAARAEEILAKHCPGPHAYVQHRDRRPPWCEACRRTAQGELVPEAGQRSDERKGQA